MLSKVLKFIFGLFIGIGIGLVIAAVSIALFTDLTFSEFFQKLSSINISEGILAAFVGIVAFIISLFFLVILHEAGHLIAGLLSGYKFVSFRIFNITFIKDNGKIKVKKFSIAGTGGQCLLLPPDLPIEQIPVFWYNAGGLIANIIVFIIVLPVFIFCHLNPYLHEAVFIFLFTDFMMILINGIPMKPGGIGNDAYNILYLNKSLSSKYGLMLQLRSNALLQQGVRPKELPADWFNDSKEINYKNALEVSALLMYASILVDKEEWESAYQSFLSLYSHKEEIMPLYNNEIACELVFLAFMTNRMEMAEKLLDKSLLQYITSYSKVMSSKMRVLCAKAYYLDNDKSKALAIYNDLFARKDEYLLKGEVLSDLALIRCFLPVE